MGSTCKIIQNKGHYELYDDSGRFISSGDTWEECYNDFAEMIAAGVKEKIRIDNIREAVAV